MVQHQRFNNFRLYSGLMAVSDWTLWIYLLGSTTFPHESCVISATVKGKILTTKTPVRNLNNFPNIGSITYLPGGTKFAPN